VDENAAPEVEGQESQDISELEGAERRTFADGPDNR